MTTLEKSGPSPRRLFLDDVNGLALVLGVLAVLMVSLPCPMSAASDASLHGNTVGHEIDVSGTKR